MSNTQISNTDLNELFMNLRDLDDISRKMSNEIEKKNQMLQSELKDCKTCRIYIDQNNRRKINK
jgi:hypothetical protein